MVELPVVVVELLVVVAGLPVVAAGPTDLAVELATGPAKLTALSADANKGVEPTAKDIPNSAVISTLPRAARAATRA